jgi:hypothetical protein
MPSKRLVGFRIEPREEDIKSVKQFVSEIFKLRAPIGDPKLWYRGHSDICYKLRPTVGREQVYVQKRVTFDCNQEISLLHRFRRRAYPEIGRAMTAGEAIFLARHHSLPTRLLDWTANALFALYFACFENPDADGKVWAMLPRAERQDLDAFKLARLKDEPDLFDYRVTDNRSTDAIKMVHPFL